MRKKFAAWFAWIISTLLLLYAKGVRGLGWLAGPADFIEYVAMPWRKYAWPFIQAWALPMLTLEGVLFAIASATLVKIYFGDHIGRWLRRSRPSSPNPDFSTAPLESAELSKQERIDRSRNMLAAAAKNSHDGGTDIRRFLLSSPDYLSLERHIHEEVKRLVRTGTFSYGIVVLSEQEAKMSYKDRVLLHLSNEINRLEREWETS